MLVAWSGGQSNLPMQCGTSNDHNEAGIQASKLLQHCLLLVTQSSLYHQNCRESTFCFKYTIFPLPCLLKQHVTSNASAYTLRLKTYGHRLKEGECSELNCLKLLLKNIETFFKASSLILFSHLDEMRVCNS